ncbi:NUDIX hydrolase [Pusillimonas sp. MFBS29]|uniref:NUDIX hydrolase n=1 Tax=Pusillimonas sp. MFBS29 TaxID=2886690 RepID=UPI001D0F9DAF|nr:NUDIX hydrolase [Pusillimonas sp. MFBS29]MCC2596683.1 NUDIX hydrolase [Pusillimonas sp. MFBS29]
MAKERSTPLASKRGAWAVIYCATTGKFLLGKRSSAVNNSGAWNLFGGRVESDEAPTKALVRELAEEAGWRVKPKRLSKLGRVAGSKNSQRVGDRELYYYLVKVDKEFVPRLNHEHSGYGWFKHKRLPGKYNLPTAVAIELGLLKNI